MKFETYKGASISELFARARAEIGADAVLVSLHRLDRGVGGYEVVAADPASVAEWKEKAAAQRQGGLSPRAPSSRGRGAPRRPRVIALIGPTGSGKTTTLAKLAGHDAAYRGRRVGLVTLDTYRVGAVEQLAAYAGLLKLPLEVIYESVDVHRALARLADREVVLVDTPGRGPRERRDLDSVRASLRRLEPQEVHLTLPAGLPPRHARDLIAGAADLGVTHILPTKLDEFPGNDEVFALSGLCGLPVRWIGDGQRVPLDLRPGPGGSGSRSTLGEGIRAKRGSGLAGSRGRAESEALPPIVESGVGAGLEAAPR